MVRINRQEHFLLKLFLVPYYMYKIRQNVLRCYLCLDLFKSINLEAVTILMGNKALNINSS